METIEIIIVNFIYMIAIALQLTAGWLLIGNISISRENIILEYCDRHKPISFDVDGNLLDQSTLNNTVHSAWTNRIAFTYLFIGYLVSVLGERTIDKISAVIGVVVLTAIIYWITCEIIKYRVKKFGTLRVEDIPHEKGTMIMMPVGKKPEDFEK